MDQNRASLPFEAVSDIGIHFAGSQDYLTLLILVEFEFVISVAYFIDFAFVLDFELGLHFPCSVYRIGSSAVSQRRSKRDS